LLPALTSSQFVVEVLPGKYTETTPLIKQRETIPGTASCNCAEMD